MSLPTRMTADVFFLPPAVGEIYVNTGTERLCVVLGWEAEHGRMHRFRRVKVQYLDNGRKTKVHLYRWDLRDWPRYAHPSTYPRMVRVRPDIRITRLKVPRDEYRIRRVHTS